MFCVAVCRQCDNCDTWTMEPAGGRQEMDGDGGQILPHPGTPALDTGGDTALVPVVPGEPRGPRLRLCRFETLVVE